MSMMKKFAMIIVIIIIASVAAFAIKRHFSVHEDDVKIQGFCLGLCGQDKNGKGFGLGIGASDRGPLVGVGPYGNKE